MFAFKSGWSKPSTIVFATECPANESNFTIALAHAKEACAKLILLHVQERSCRVKPLDAAPHAANREVIRPPKDLLEPLAERARDLDIDCEIVLREGSAAEEILKFARERYVDRVVMGVHTSGPVGKLLVGSVAETLLRLANIPAAMISPYVRDGAYLNFLTRTIICSVNEHPSSQATARFACELAAQYHARLILHRAIPPQRSATLLAGRAPSEVERTLLEMVPARLRSKVRLEAKLTVGDPAEELLRQGRVLRANAIVMDARNATHFAAETNAGVAYKVLAYASCPVIALSPVVLAGAGVETQIPRYSEINFTAGVV